MPRYGIIGGGALVVANMLPACVTSGTHQAIVDDFNKTRTELEDTRTKLTKENEEVSGKLVTCSDDLTIARDQNEQLVTRVAAMGTNVEQLLGEKDKLAAEHEALASEIAELRRMRAAAEARNAEYRQVMERLKKMVDAGQLKVSPREGRLVVQMSSDVLFPPGGTRIKSAAREAIEELAATIREFKGRKFQVLGHSDPTPIRTPRFPSNWELSSQRAIEVVKLMIEAGVPPEMLSAAGAAEFDPMVPNETPEEREMNRRVEVIFLPKLDELPGFGHAAAQLDPSPGSLTGGSESGVTAHAAKTPGPSPSATRR